MSLRTKIQFYQPYDEREADDKSVFLHCFKTFPDLLTRENRLCHFTASCWIVNENHDKALLIFHNLAKQWRWPGGHTDGESDLFSVALREAKEETNLANLQPLSHDIFSLEILAVTAHERRHKLVNAHLHLNCSFIFEANESEPIKIKPDENSDIRWVTFAEIDKAISDGKVSSFYTKLIQKTNEFYQK